MKRIRRIFVILAGATVLGIGIAMIAFPPPAFIMIPATGILPAALAASGEGLRWDVMELV